MKNLNQNIFKIVFSMALALCTTGQILASARRRPRVGAAQEYHNPPPTPVDSLESEPIGMKRPAQRLRHLDDITRPPPILDDRHLLSGSYERQRPVAQRTPFPVDLDRR